MGGSMEGKIVLVLGAGFSRAVSDLLPLTDELGNLILGRLGSRTPRFERGYFETWLSRLAEVQPDLTESRNLENRALFLRIADSLYSILREREAEALRTGAPSWLLRLMGLAPPPRTTGPTAHYV